MADVFFCEILSNEPIANDIFSTIIKCGEFAHKATAGQFLHIKCGNERILRRPISICDITGTEMRFIFEVKGEGTRWLSERKAGEKLNVLGALGNGFYIPGNIETNKRVVVIGGGIGSPPMLLAAKTAKKAGYTKIDTILGFRSKDRVILVDEFSDISDNTIITTEDGSAGFHGLVTNPLEDMIKKGDVGFVMSCGRLIMQKAVAELLMQHNIPHLVSLEERMGCGVGACLVCACATVNRTKAEPIPKMSHVCVDGPVFDAKDVVW